MRVSDMVAGDGSEWSDVDLAEQGNWAVDDEVSVTRGVTSDDGRGSDGRTSVGSGGSL